MPDFSDPVNDAREYIGNLLVGSMASAEFAVMTSVERDVAGIDGSSGLESGLNLRQGPSTLNLITEQF